MNSEQRRRLARLEVDRSRLVRGRLAWLATLSDDDVELMAEVAEHVKAGTADTLPPEVVQRANAIMATEAVA